MAQNEQHQPSNLFLVDALYCEEEHWEEEQQQAEHQEEEEELAETDNSINETSFSLLEQDLFWEDDDLQSLSIKEQHTRIPNYLDSDPCLAAARKEAVEWMLRVNAHYAFSALTAVLSVNYLDRFLGSLHFQRDKPWMTQLAAVACLALAAKVEETQVPLLLDLQVEETRYVFEAKTIQRMELLVLSTLNWKMNPVTPLSFIDHIIRRLGLKTHRHWDFLRSCERRLLSVIADSRFVCYLPSIFAAATMLHVINQLEPSNPLDYENQLLIVLRISKEKVADCLQLVDELTRRGHKRKYPFAPDSPNGVLDSTFSYQGSSSNDSWASAASSPPNLLCSRNPSLIISNCDSLH